MLPGRVRLLCTFACFASALSLLFCAFNSKAQEGPTVVAEAPPLVWPAWLVHLDGGQLKIQQGVDQSKKDYLRAVFYTHAPMTQIHTFYEDLLKTNDYRIVTAGLQTGHTISGNSQNAWGHVEADNYPNGQPGPYTNIRVDFGRSVRKHKTQRAPICSLRAGNLSQAQAAAVAASSPFFSSAGKSR
jgi:hypothetical protein